MWSSSVLNFLQASALLSRPPLQCFRHARSAAMRVQRCKQAPHCSVPGAKNILLSAEVNIAVAEQSVSCSGSAPEHRLRRLTPVRQRQSTFQGGAGRRNFKGTHRKPNPIRPRFRSPLYLFTNLCAFFHWMTVQFLTLVLFLLQSNDGWSEHENVSIYERVAAKDDDKRGVYI